LLKITVGNVQTIALRARKKLKQFFEGMPDEIRAAMPDWLQD
jgi:hypothetical protein